MQKRTPDNSGLEVSALSLGCMRGMFGDAPVSRAEMIASLHQAIAQGSRFAIRLKVYGPFTRFC